MIFQSVKQCILLASILIASTGVIGAGDDAEWVETENVIPSTRKIYRGTKKTTTREAEFVPHTSYVLKRPTTSFPFGVASYSTSTIRPSTPSSTILTDHIVTLLRNFTKLTTNHPSSKDCGEDCLTTIMRLEIFTMASGNHFILPPFVDEKTEQKQRKKAGAVGNLWLDLFCTEDVDSMMRNATLETVARYESTFAGKSLTKDMLREIFEILFNNLESAIQKDDFLSTMYTAEQIRFAIPFLDPSTEEKLFFPFEDLKPGQGDVDKEKLTLWLNNTNIRKFLIHRLFLLAAKDTVDTESQDKITARSILKVARERLTIEPMQKIYNKALDECAKNFKVADFPQKVFRTFIDELTRAIEANEKVNEEWIKQKERIQEKSRSTKYKDRRTNDIISS